MFKNILKFSIWWNKKAKLNELITIKYLEKLISFIKKEENNRYKNLYGFNIQNVFQLYPIFFLEHIFRLHCVCKIAMYSVRLINSARNKKRQRNVIPKTNDHLYICLLAVHCERSFLLNSYKLRRLSTCL